MDLMTKVPSCVAMICAAKQDRLRQAKAEAEREIAAYRAEREGAYQKKLSEVRVNGGLQCRPVQQHVREPGDQSLKHAVSVQSSSGAQTTLQRLAGETTLSVQKIQADVKARKSQVCCPCR